jgi:predicted enzyme related to lactoylglutathione lyase
MATRQKTAKKKTVKPARKAAVKKKMPARRSTAKRAATTRRVTAKRTSAKRTSAKRTTAKRKAANRPPVIRHGVITHTEFASADPAASQAWFERVLGWKFMDPMPTPTGPYRMWRFPNDTGGGIRGHNPPEVPGAIPYCEVNDIRGMYRRALAAGATEMLPPMALAEGMGWVAIVAVPGGMALGFWSMK